MAKRLNINLSDEVANAVVRMSEEDLMTFSDVIRRSISTEVFFREARSKGEKVMLMDPESKELREIVFR